MNKQSLLSIIDDLRAGRTPSMDPSTFTAFFDDGSNPYLTPNALESVAKSLGPDDVPTFERAVAAIDAEELAWLGFKVVYDPETAVSNVDNEVTKKYGDIGSADGEHLVFFCNDTKEIVSSRGPSPRDLFQMKDVTRGPSMHNAQFDGLIWASAPLHESIRVWLLGASDVASELEKLAIHVGFETTVVDYDRAYINETRFPDSTRILLEGGTFEGLDAFSADATDYVCVLTRGHMFDPEGCLWASRHHVHYIGMMGCAGKNNTVHDICIANGMTEDQWDSVKRPIGLKFGAKTPAELAIAIVAELIDVRYRQRYSESAREKHEKSLGR
ncbi:MAG: XdhC family protein [Eggerthellaceae bacterium]|nr:XdhC family protein [Eggerthellaceae bacterium]